jgi:hypothetical protein
MCRELVRRKVQLMNSHRILGKIAFQRCCRSANFLVAILCFGVVYLFIPMTAARQAKQSPNSVFLDAPSAIYAPDPNDSWNKIFFYLFSRRVETRVTDEFPEFRDATPFVHQENPTGATLPSSIGVSTQSFERDEVGDRAIDPLYPSFLRSKGAEVVLNEPGYSELSKALGQALGENTTRSPLARALMQADLWSAYDTLYSTRYSQRPMPDTEQRRALLDLLARLIRKIALTDREIDSLPVNYSVAAPLQSLPDLFRNDSEWLEVRWMPHLHDYSAGYRRVTRVFLKPERPPQDVQAFLNSLPRNQRLLSALNGVALVTQLVLIDKDGLSRPTSLTTEVQVRLFEKASDGDLKRTSIQVSEISRRQLINNPPSGGLVAEDENAPAYRANGNDYTFASPQPSLGTPILVRLRTRCTACHGEHLAIVMTFAFNIDLKATIPPVRQLNPLAHQAAEAVIEKKVKQKDFESLREIFNASGPRTDPSY